MDVTTVNEPSDAVAPAEGDRINLRRPEFFIVGAPRCATTALYTYLRQHPRIFMPDCKEPHYFCDDLDFPGRVRTLHDYRELFAPAPEGSLVGEASVYYFLSKEAPARIREFNPDARIIIMLRDPIDLMHSLHAFNSVHGTEDVLDFRTALELEEPRKRGEQLPPPPVIEHFKLFYRELARYTEHVRCWFEHFGRDRVHVILLEEFRKDPEAAFYEVCDFLRIERIEGLRYEVVHANKALRFRALSDFLRRPPGAVRWVARRLLPESVRKQVVLRLHAANETQRRRPTLDARDRAELNEEFRPEVERLGRLLGREITVWCRPPKHGAAGVET
jgi:hypothetical protein